PPSHAHTRARPTPAARGGVDTASTSTSPDQGKPLTAPERGAVSCAHVRFPGSRKPRAEPALPPRDQVQRDCLQPRATPANRKPLDRDDEAIPMNICAAPI